jgi:flagellar motor switch protein FliN/FliY
VIDQSDEKNISSGPEAGAKAARINSKLIENVGVTLEAFLGEACMTVAEFTELKGGAVVPLDATLNQAVELRLNGVTVAKGELVSVGAKFGIRLVEISK